MSRTPIHGNPRNEYPQEALNRNLSELGLPEQNASEEELLKRVPIIGLLRSLGQQSQVNEQLGNPELLHNTAGRGLETNFQRGGPSDTFGKEAGVQMMSEGGVAGTDGMVSGMPQEHEPERGTAGIEIPEEIKEFIENAHKERRESRPDEGWRIKSAEKPDTIAPYKRDEASEFEALPEGVREEGSGSSELPNYADGGTVDQPFDPNQLLQDIAPAGTGALVPSPAPPQPDGAPIAPPPMPAAASPVPAAPIVPRGTVPGPTDQDFMSRANKMLGLDPNQTASFMKMLGDRSQKAQLGAGLAGIGDAIASGGTLGKVNPGALNKSEELIQGRTKEGLEGLQTIREGQKESFGLGQTLRGNEPFSPEIQKSLVRQFHIPAGLAGSPRDVIYKMLDPIAQTQLKEAELAASQSYKTQALDLQKKQLEATIGNQKAERAATKEQHQIEATKTLADRGVVKRGLDALTGNEATKTLERVSKGEESAGPFGAETVRNGKTYEWSPATGKYHLKQ